MWVPICSVGHGWADGGLTLNRSLEDEAIAASKQGLHLVVFLKYVPMR